MRATVATATRKKAGGARKAKGAQVVRGIRPTIERVTRTVQVEMRRCSACGFEWEAVRVKDPVKCHSCQKKFAA